MSAGEDAISNEVNVDGKLGNDVMPGGVNKVCRRDPDKSASVVRPVNPLKSASCIRGGRPLIDVTLGG